MEKYIFRTQAIYLVKNDYVSTFKSLCLKVRTKLVRVLYIKEFSEWTFSITGGAESKS